MTEDKERDEALIAEIAEVFPPDTVDVQSRYVIVHQLRASADIQDAQTKRETGWADTSDRACLMRKAADTLDALLHKLQPAPKPDRWTLAARETKDCFLQHWNLGAATKAAAAVLRKHFPEAERSHGTDWFKGEVDCDGNELVTLPKDELDKYKDQVRYTCQRAEKAEARVKELEAKRPAVVVPFGDDVIAAARFYADVPVAESRIVIMANAILDGAKGGE